MPRKYSPEDRAKWLKLSLEGKTDSAIANNLKIDWRTVRDGIAQARREQEAREARIGLIRDALRRHQEGLLEGLGGLECSIAPPPIEREQLNWHRTKEDSVFQDKKEVEERLRQAYRPEDKAKPSPLRQHIRANRFWKALREWQEAYLAHLLARVELQYKTIELVRAKTGLPVLPDAEAKAPPFVYSPNTCHILYTYAVGFALKGEDDKELAERMHTDASRHWVTIDAGSILAELTGNESGVRSLLLQAYGELKASPELADMASTYRKLEKLAPSLKEAISSYRALGLLPGTCSICSRIGA